MIEALSSKNLPAPRFRYSPLIKAGPFYKTAGMIALDKDSGVLEPARTAVGISVLSLQANVEIEFMFYKNQE